MKIDPRKSVRENSTQALSQKASKQNPACSSLAILMGLTVCAGSASAAPFGILRSLQSGPAGDSPQFADLHQFDGDAALTIERRFGDYSINDNSDEKVTASSFRSKVTAGGSFQPTKEFAITTTIEATLASDYDEEQDRAAKKSHLDSGMYDHELYVLGMYRASSFVFGGGIGVKLFSQETREFKYDGAKYSNQVGSAAMPVLRLFGGLSTKEIDLTGGVRFFSHGSAVVESKNPAGTKNEFDTTRRNPGELHVDGRLKFAQADVGASIAYVLSGQASESVDEFSMAYQTSASGKKRRTTGGERRDQNHVRVGVGGRFSPVKMFSVLGGLSYIGSSYAKEEYASIEHDNLGSMRFDLGADVAVQQFRGFLHMGYDLESTASYTLADNSRAFGAVDRTQRAPLAKGDSVKVKQGSWDITLGGGIQL